MHRPLPSAPTELAVPLLVRSHSGGAHCPTARPLPLPAPHLVSSNLSLAPSSAPHHARPGKPGPFAQELFVLFLHVSEFLPPSSSYQWTTETGSIDPVFSKSAAFLHASPLLVCHGVQISVMMSLSFSLNSSCLKSPSIQPSESKCESPTSPDTLLRTRASHEQLHADMCTDSQSGKAQAGIPRPDGRHNLRQSKRSCTCNSHFSSTHQQCKTHRWPSRPLQKRAFLPQDKSTIVTTHTLIQPLSIEVLWCHTNIPSNRIQIQIQPLSSHTRGRQVTCNIESNRVRD